MSDVVVQRGAPTDAGGMRSVTTEPRVIGPSARAVRVVAGNPIVVIGPQDPMVVRPAPIRIDLIRAVPTEVRPTVVAVAPLVAVTIEAPPRAAWDDRGWRLGQHGGEQVYTGWYHVTNRNTGQPLRFEGRITERGRTVVPYIADPPVDIRRHPKAPCFTVTHAPWFRIHWYRPAANVDDALLYVERILDEAINGRR